MNADGMVPEHKSTTISESRLRRFDRFLTRYVLFGGAVVFGKLAAFSIVLLTLVTFVTVVGRRSPWSGPWLIGGLEVSELLMAVVSIYAAAYCWYLDGHLRITFIKERVSAKTGNVLDLLASFCFTIWFGVISWGMWVMAMTYIRSGAKGWSVGIPIGPIMVVYFVAAAFFFVVLLKDLIGQVMKVMGRSI